MTAPSTVAFLDALFADVPAELWLGFTAVEPGADWTDRQRRTHRCFPASDLDAAADWCGSWGQARNVYVRCLPMASEPSSGRGDRSLSTALVGVWADLDFAGPGHKRNEDGRALPPDVEACEAVIAAVGATPTVVLHTGGGLQPWWLLDAPVVADDDDGRRRIAAVARRWVETIQRHAWIVGGGTDEHPERGWHADAVGDPARVLRMPGTWRLKLDADGAPLPPWRVTIHDVGEWPDGLAFDRPWRPGPRYTVAELEELLLDPPPALDRRSADELADIGQLQEPSYRRGQEGDDYGPADAFAELEWSDILAPAGWTHWKTVTVDGDEAELWRRPGGSSPYSLKAWRHAAVCWSGNAGLPVGVGMSKFQLWCHLHRLTASEAARLVRAEADRRRRVKR